MAAEQSTLAPIRSPRAAKRLTRLRLRSRPMIALGFLLAALTTFAAPTVLIIAALGARSAMDRQTMVGLAAVITLAACGQIASFIPALWILHRRRLVSSGRRWFVLTGLVAGALAAGAIGLPNLFGQTYPLVVSLIGILVLAAAGGLLGALGGLVFSLTATRRAPLEAVFE